MRTLLRHRARQDLPWQINHTSKCFGREYPFWNQWRAAYPDVRPDLRGAYLAEADLTEPDLINADLRGVDLTKAELEEADLTRVTLIKADLTEAEVD
ncbi:MAG: pentapeptide repeat-containing protein [Euryarchaeota archaeon]|nr:pentapeptide repeat-containing protein [Euryarchaeota archaeon]